MKTLNLTLTFQLQNEYGSFSGHGQHMCEVIFIIVVCQFIIIFFVKRCKISHLTLTFGPKKMI